MEPGATSGPSNLPLLPPNLLHYLLVTAPSVYQEKMDEAKMDTTYQWSARVIFSISRRESEFHRFNLADRDETENF